MPALTMESPEEDGLMTSDPQHQDVLLPSAVTRALGSSSASTTEIPTDNNNYLFAGELPVVRSPPASQDVPTSAGGFAADQQITIDCLCERRTSVQLGGLFCFVY